MSLSCFPCRPNCLKIYLPHSNFSFTWSEEICPCSVWFLYSTLKLEAKCIIWHPFSCSELSVQMATETPSDLYLLSSGGKMDHVLFHCLWHGCPATPAVIWGNQLQIINSRAGGVFSKHTSTRQMPPDVEREPKLSSWYSSGTKTYWKLQWLKWNNKVKYWEWWVFRAQKLRQYNVHVFRLWSSSSITFILMWNHRINDKVNQHYRYSTLLGWL